MWQTMEEKATLSITLRNNQIVWMHEHRNDAVHECLHKFINSVLLNDF